MPELPEVQTIVSELNRKLAGKRIKSVQVLLPKIIAIGPGTVSNIRQSGRSQAYLFVRKVQGQRIKTVKRRAKLLIFDFFGPFSMLVHLKMTGQFIYLKKSELKKKIRIINSNTSPAYVMPCKYTHAIFTFIDGSKLFYNDVRQFGYLKLVSDEELLYVQDLQEFGPEPLDKKFTFGVFKDILAARPKGKIKQVLTEQKLIAGIGNIYSDEILFQAKVRPDRKVLTIKNQKAGKIFTKIKEVLNKAIAVHGSSVGDFVRTDGSWGGMGEYHFVYGRAGENCKVCGGAIKAMKFNGRTGSYCPKCQK